MSGTPINACIACGHSRLDALAGYEHAHLVRCRKCRLVFCSVDPGPEVLAEYYSRYGVSQPLPPITVKRYRELLQSWEPYRKRNTILDVGCGVGHLLALARETGWTVYGTELSSGTCSICRDKGIDMFLGKVSHAPFQDGMFDVIVSIEVIEHINHPNEDLAAMYRLLRPGGILYITTPNFNSLSRRLIGSRYNIIQYPEHLTYYTPATLKRTVENHGFQCKRITTSGINFSRISGSRKKQPEKDTRSHKAQQHSGDDPIRTLLEEKPLLKLVKQTINGILHTTRLGDAMKATFVKPGG